MCVCVIYINFVVSKKLVGSFVLIIIAALNNNNNIETKLFHIKPILEKIVYDI